MGPLWLTRRMFLRAAAVFGLAGGIDLKGLIADERPKKSIAAGGVVVYRRSGRGRHVSRAAKKQNANRLYATAEAAAADLAHLGDHSVVVPVVIGAGLFQSLFGAGRPIADLRRDLQTPSDFRLLQQCLSGPGIAVGATCTGGDRDHDADVDLKDIAAIQRTYTGPVK